MEKTYDEIIRETDAVIDHQQFSEKLILLLVVVSAIMGLAGFSKIWTMLWVLPTFGYLLGRHVTENLHYLNSEYWKLSLGSQVLLAVIVGVPLLIRFGI